MYCYKFLQIEEFYVENYFLQLIILLFRIFGYVVKELVNYLPIYRLYVIYKDILLHKARSESNECVRSDEKNKATVIWTYMQKIERGYQKSA